MSITTQAEAQTLQLAYKPYELRSAMVAIVSTALHQPASPIWPDEIEFDDIQSDSKSAIGNSFKTLRLAHLIERTGEYRTSKQPSHRGRTIFAWRLVNVSLAETFLKRNGEVPPTGQLALL